MTKSMPYTHAVPFSRPAGRRRIEVVSTKIGRRMCLGGLAPYRVEHINRFGDYSLDLERQVPPMQFETNLI